MSGPGLTSQKGYGRAYNGTEEEEQQQGTTPAQRFYSLEVTTTNAFMNGTGGRNGNIICHNTRTSKHQLKGQSFKTMNISQLPKVSSRAC